MSKRAANAMRKALLRLSVCCGEANALQHAGLEVPPSVWAEMYQADQHARAVLAETPRANARLPNS
jgi:hypothetical protein